jgi:hypothetical protein
MARSMDNEAGGAADLQTDVMRFMAILSLCLVAIFALVQSLPLVPTESPPAPLPEPERRAPVTEPIENPEPITKPQPAARQTVRADPLPPTPTPTPTSPAPAKAASAKAAPAETKPAPAATQDGFTLRFETGQALTQLVAQNEIGLYAISAGQALRMTMNRDRAEFWSASLPKQFHEMDTSTVPKAVINALMLSNDFGTDPAIWGVTLPATMSASLNKFMHENSGGSLIIGADGNLRLEP